MVISPVVSVSVNVNVEVGARDQQTQTPTSYHILLYTLSFGLGDTGRCWVVFGARTNTSTNQLLFKTNQLYGYLHG